MAKQITLKEVRREVLPIKEGDQNLAAPRGGAVVLLSGGMDSALVLAKLVKEEAADPRRIACLWFDYGQVSAQAEWIAARRQAKCFGVSQVYAYRLTQNSIHSPPLFAGTSLIEGGDFKSAKATFVPGRNIIFLSLATSLAYSLGARVVGIGTTETTETGAGQMHPDTTSAFITAFQAVAEIGLGSDMTLYSPLHGMVKPEIALAAHELGVRLNDTVSCFRAQCHTIKLRGPTVVRSGYLHRLVKAREWFTHCRTCSSCQDRLWAQETHPDLPITNMAAARDRWKRGVRHDFDVKPEEVWPQPNGLPW